MNTSAKHRHLTLAAAGMAMLVLAGCAGKTPMEQALDREAALHERAEQRISESQSRQGDVIDTLPEWIVKKPTADSAGVYGAGMGTSQSLSLALQKASIDARRDVAQEIDETLSAETTMAGVGDASFQSIVNTFIDSVNVAGAEDVERVIQSGRDGYRVYSLIKLPYPEFNEALARFSRQDQQGASTMRAQYEQLMERVSNTPAFEPEPQSQAQSGSDNVVTIDQAMPDEALVRALQQR